MAIFKASGQISSMEIRMFFRQSSEDAFHINDYYRGGGIVPAVDTDGNSINENIPESGQIKFSDFYGANDGRNT